MRRDTSIGSRAALRLRDRPLGPGGERVGGVQQGAIHVDGDQFDGRLPAAHVHCVQLVRGTPV